MGLEVWYGPAGCGKSTKLQETVIEEAMHNPSANYIYIVPDQFTMQTQMDVVKRHPRGGILNIDVLSFSRLCYRVFQETGIPGQPVLDDTGKSLVIRHVAAKVSDRMPYIGCNINKIGYVHEIKSAISEFMQYGISSKDISKLAEGEDGALLGIKLRDLAVIYDAFMQYNKDRFITGEEKLDILCDKLEKSKFIKDSVIVFDGFTGFTPIQEKVIVKLMQLASKVRISFTLSAPESPDETGGEEKLFYLSRRSARRLKTMAGDAGVKVLPDVVISAEKGRFSDNSELVHLEKNLFRYPYETFNTETESIGILSASSVEAEVSEVALKIHRLIKDEGYAYRDIAIVTGNLEAYAPSLERRLSELEMPYFVDRTNSIILNPFTEYLKSALQIMIKDYSYDSVFHFLRSGFTNFTDEETDRFANYVTSLNLRGSKTYHNEFKKRQKGNARDKFERELPIHEDLRKRLIEELSVLERPAKTAGDYVRNLYDFIVKNESFQKLRTFEEEFSSDGDAAKAKEYSQIYKAVMELLDTISGLVGEEEMDLAEFYKVFEAGLSEIRIGLIPGNVDRIVIGDIERTRLCEVKALFFMGVNDGNIPKAGDKRSFLSNMDREKLLEKGVELAPTLREEMFTQRLYLYMNLLKPSKKLFISYCGTDAEGKQAHPSYLIDVLCKIFPKMTVRKADERITAEKLVTIKDSLRFYAKLAREYATGALDDAYKKLSAALLNVYRGKGIASADKITEAAFTEYVASPLSKEIVRLLYKDVLRASISTMEQYAGCAYKYFLSFGLELKEEINYDFTKRDLGTIYHGILDAFSTVLERRGLTWLTFTEEEGKELIEEAVTEYCNNYEQSMLLEDEQSMYLKSRIAKMMERTIDTIRFQLSSGKFVPTDHECKFERRIPIDNGTLFLKGKIDRIDLYENDGKLYVKIVDFKSRRYNLDITDIYHGLRQQLCVYMSEALKFVEERNPGRKAVPSAMFYYDIENPFVVSDKEMSPEAVEQEIRKKLKLEGILDVDDENVRALDENAAGDGMVLPIRYKKDGTLYSDSEKRAVSSEEMLNMLSYVNKLIEKIGSDILAGNKAVNPMKTKDNDSCAFCAYKGICRYDEKIPGFKARDGHEINSEDARKTVMGGGDCGLYLFS